MNRSLIGGYVSYGNANLKTKVQTQEGMNSIKKILVVEDDLELTTVLDRVIKAIDPKLITVWVTSAEQATSLLEDCYAKKELNPFDLILADIFLEGTGTGLDLWKTCQQYFPEIPVVVTSALPVDKFFSVVGKDAISPPFLPKPFLPGECKQLLEGILHYNERVAH